MGAIGHVSRCVAQNGHRKPAKVGPRALLALAALLALVAMVPAVAAAAPTHPLLEGASLDGSTTPSLEFDKACGVAVDSDGNVYVANSNNSAIDVFDSSGAYLTSIADANGPCGLAVDGAGNVYAVDTATGNVVLFAPTGGTFPPTAGLTYAAAVTVDSSTVARAVAVNPANDHVFVNRGTEIVEYDVKGTALLKSEIGKGTLTQGFGVDVYDATGNVYASDESGEVYVFNPAGTEVLTTIDGSESPVGTFGTLPQANIAVNQSNGHVLVSDVKEGGAVYEFESTGPYLSTIEHEDLVDAAPSDVAVDPSEGTLTAGRIYVSAGPGPGAEVLAFGPLPVPTHPRLPELDPKGSETPAKQFQNACGVAVDNQGNVYVTSTGTSAIDIFRPEGNELRYLTTINSEKPCGAAVDSKGTLYIAHPTEPLGKNTVTKYVPNKYPFEGTPTYSAPVVVDPGGEFASFGLAVNPANDHLLVAHRKTIWEYDSAASGSAKLREDIGAGILSENSGIGVCARTGNVYAVSGPAVWVIDPDTNKTVAIINGSNAVSKKPDGGFGGSLGSSQLAVDQADCHVYVNVQGGDIYEFEESGAYVSRFNRSTASGPLNGIAVDNSAAHPRDIFAATGVGVEPAVVQAYEGPAQYGTPPEAVLSGLSGANGSEATLEGTVDPGGVELNACEFEYVEESAFQATGFATATSAPCVPGPAGIGDGDDPVAVSAHVTGLSPSLSYRFRLVVGNSFGTDASNPGRFGPPAIKPLPPSEILYTEAILDAELDPAGLETKYFFEYGPTTAYGATTAPEELSGEDFELVRGELFGLAQGTTYHFRLVASNAIGTAAGPDQTFTTLIESQPGAGCPNEEFRSGPSAALPDCRAFELVSPPDVGGRTLGDLRAATGNFLAPMATPSGDSLLFYTEGALPGTDGNGVKDAYESTRSASGWVTRLAGPSGAQSVVPAAGGVSADHRYSFWTSGGFGGSLDVGGSPANHLREPGGGFELVGLGESISDPDAVGRWITPDGGKLIFTSTVPLTSNAPPAGTAAVYERGPGGSAQLLSLLPGGIVPGAGQDAIYEGASADGSAVAFRIGSTLYLRRGGASVAAASGDVAFGGFSQDGSRLFYVDLSIPAAPTAVQRGEIFVYDTVDLASGPIGSGGEAVLVNVAADGSHVYFASRAQLEAGKGLLGAENLYVFDGASVRFIAVLDSEDIESSGDQAAQRLGSWAQAVQPLGPLATDPSRTTPGGEVLVFESLAPLTAYDNEGAPEIYRYDAGTGQLGCVSCPADDQAAGDGARLQTRRSEVRDSPADDASQIAGVTADGAAVFFETAVGLVPADHDGVRDVYEWRGGEVFQISTGGGEAPSYLYAMGADGRDVFIATSATLLPVDTDGGARSIYDARENGGFPAPGPDLPCQADECKGQPAPAPVLPAPASVGLQDPGNLKPAGRKCPRGKRAVKRGGKVRCVIKHKKKKGKAKRGARARGGGR
jgi:sugar lactone lactonase YvrE